MAMCLHEPLAVLNESPPNQMSSSSVLTSDRQRLPECKLEETQDMSKLDANDSFIKTQPEEELYEPSDSALTFMVLSLFSLLGLLLKSQSRFAFYLSLY